jgi:hypothetical protein
LSGFVGEDDRLDDDVDLKALMEGKTEEELKK